MKFKVTQITDPAIRWRGGRYGMRTLALSHLNETFEGGVSGQEGGKDESMERGERGGYSSS